MKTAYAVTGYVSNQLARKLSNKELRGIIDVKPELGRDEVVARVSSEQIAEVRVGSSIKGETLVQLILRDNAQVETVIKTSANIKGIQQFNDPVLTRLVASATAKSIAV
jgi:hypothetical protein